MLKLFQVSRLSKSALLILLAATATAAVFYPRARLLAIAAAGRSSVCPLSAALKSHGNLRDQIRYKDQILAASRLVEEDPKGFELWETPQGRYWVPKGSRWVLPFNLAERQRKIYGSGDQAVQSGDIVLDCGANVGTDTRAWVEIGAKLVVAIEPAPENIECLRRNFKNEIASGQVILIEKGVWDKEDTLTFRVDPKNSAADSFVISHEGSASVAHIPVTTIDRIVDDLHLARVDYIKMDVEGAEQRALEGARRTIARDRPKLTLATEHRLDDAETLIAAVNRIRPGYRMECGPCAEEKGHIRPDVLYFR